MQTIKYRGYTYWVAGIEGNYKGFISAVPNKIAESDRTFQTELETIDHLKEQIDLACGDPVSYVSSRGYTLLEVLVVITMIGILSAIAAPSWLSFLNNQRVNTANGKVFQAINQAKSEAKSKKVTRTVEFRMNGTVAEYAIYSNGETPIWLTIPEDVVVSAIAIPIDSKGTIDPTDVPAQVTVTKGNLKRCTSIVTLLGAIRQGSNAECP